MRKIIFFCFICTVSTGALLAGISMKNSWFGIAISAFVWFIFIGYYAAKSKRNRYQKERERMFNNWFDQQYRRRTY